MPKLILLIPSDVNTPSVYTKADPFTLLEAGKTGHQQIETLSISPSLGLCYLCDEKVPNGKIRKACSTYIPVCGTVIIFASDKDGKPADVPRNTHSNLTQILKNDLNQRERYYKFLSKEGFQFI